MGGNPTASDSGKRPFPAYIIKGVGNPDLMILHHLPVTARMRGNVSSCDKLLSFPIFPGTYPPMRQLPLLSAITAIGLISAALQAENSAAPDPPGLQQENTAAKPENQSGAETPDNLQAALAALELPGVKINIEEWAVDVDARICLREGMLELIACTPDSKEHEAIIVIDARPSHIHTALLLLGARPGNPAMMRIVSDDGEDPDAQPRFIHIPPRGAPVDVLLVFGKEGGKKKEHPISDFLVKADHDDFGFGREAEEKEEPERFPGNTFLFTGSLLDSEGDGPPRYLADHSGHVITISTFGDELLGLDGIHAHDNAALVWEVDGTNLPPLDSKVTLRLRVQRPPAKPAE